MAGGQAFCCRVRTSGSFPLLVSFLSRWVLRLSTNSEEAVSSITLQTSDETLLSPPCGCCFVQHVTPTMAATTASEVHRPVSCAGGPNKAAQAPWLT